MKEDKFNSLWFSEAIKNKRDRLRWGLRAAAQEIGISAATLSRIENQKMPDIITFKLVCDWIERDMNFFFD